MNRTEFLAALALRLEDLPADERDEAVKYYSEYLDEVGMGGEDAAIAELGGAEKVSNIIRANCGLGPYRPTDKAAAKPELTLDSPSYSQAVENTVQSSQAAAQAASAASAAAANAATAAAAAQTAAQTASAASAANTAAAQSAFTPPVYTSSSGNPFAGQAPDARNVYSAASAAQQATTPPTYGATTAAPPTYPGTQPRYNQNNNRILWILIIIASSPIWLGLLGGAFGLVFGIFGTLIGLLASGFGMFIAGIVHAVLAVPLFLTSPGTALATIGMSLLAAGIGALLGSGMVFACGKVFPFIGKVFSGVFGWVRGKVSGR